MLKPFKAFRAAMINDSHCHFFSRRFFELLAAPRPDRGGTDPAGRVTRELGWDTPGTAAELADRWALELDRHGVSRAALIASLPGDEESVAEAVARHPSRFVGFFMLDPTAPDAAQRLARSLGPRGLRSVCLYPAMHQYPLYDERVDAVFEAAAARPGAAVFVHSHVFRTALEVMGPDRLVFGTDSSFFPRGWQRAIYDAQRSALGEAGIDRDVQGGIFAGNFDRLFTP